MVQKTLDLVAVGDPIIDLITTPEGERIESFGGSSANVAVHLSRHGLRTGLIGAVGNDHNGEEALLNLYHEGVDTQRMRKCPAQTKTWIMETSPHSYHRLHKEGNAGLTECEQQDLEYVKKSRSLYIPFHHRLYSSLSIISKETDLLLIVTLQDAYKKNRPDLLLKRKIAVLFSNDSEASWAKPHIGELIRGGDTIVAVTRGREGCEIYYKSRQEIYPAFKVNSIDPIGAGDAFAAGFIYGYLKGWELPRTCAYANAMGALATTDYGSRRRRITESDVLSLIGQP